MSTVPFEISQSPVTCKPANTQTQENTLPRVNTKQLLASAVWAGAAGVIGVTASMIAYAFCMAAS